MRKPTPKQAEKRRRIQVALWAYAYEVKNVSIVDDATYDRVCREINVEMTTDNRRLDIFFKNEFDPSTGLWIHKHPELYKIAALFERVMCSIEATEAEPATPTAPEQLGLF